MRRKSTAPSQEIRQMMAETTTCLACGRPLKYSQSKEARQNRGYCHRTCYLAKPPKMAYAEKAWGKPIAQLLVDLLNRHTVEATAHLVGIEKHALYGWLEKCRIRKVTRWEAS